MLCYTDLVAQAGSVFAVGIATLRKSTSLLLSFHGANHVVATNHWVRLNLDDRGFCSLFMVLVHGFLRNPGWFPARNPFCSRRGVLVVVWGCFAMRRADGFVQPFRDALRERMILFTEEELEKLRAALDEDAESPSDVSKVFPEVPVRYQAISVAVSDEGLLGTTLAGTEIFQIPNSRMPETLTAATLIELAADALSVQANSLTLWEGQFHWVG